MESLIQTIGVLLIIASLAKKFNRAVSKPATEKEKTVTPREQTAQVQRAAQVRKGQSQVHRPTNHKRSSDRPTTKKNISKPAVQPIGAFASMEDLTEKPPLEKNEPLKVQDENPAPWLKNLTRLNENDLVQAVVMSEILGKPKALRR